MFEASEFSNWVQAREKNLEEKVKRLEEELKMMRFRDLSANRTIREMAWLITGLVIKDMKGTTKFERNIVGGETDFTYTIEIDNNQFIGIRIFCTEYPLYTAGQNGQKTTLTASVTTMAICSNIKQLRCVYFVFTMQPEFSLWVNFVLFII